LKTNQILERDFLGGTVRQEHKTKFFCVNDLTVIANKYRENKGLSTTNFKLYKKADKSKEFFETLMREENCAEIIKTKRGANGATWVHPLVLFDYAMWLSPEFKVRVYNWLYDNLTEFRDNSGDSFKELNSVIAQTGDRNPIELRTVIQAVARGIKKYLHVEDWNRATESQLKARDEIQKSISLLLKAGVDINTAFKTAVENTKYSVIDDAANYKKVA